VPNLDPATLAVLKSIPAEQIDEAIGVLLPGSVQVFPASEQIMDEAWFSRPMRIKRGDYVEGHAHKYDHLMVFARGKAEITLNGKTFVVEGYSRFNVKAGVIHGFRALTDVYAECIYVNRDGLDREQYS